MQINGKELAVEIAGEGPAVLMVHGLGATTNFYQVQTDALVADHTVIRVDSAGAGRSEVSDGISVESHADDLAALLDELQHRLGRGGRATRWAPSWSARSRPATPTRSPRSPCSVPSVNRPRPAGRPSATAPRSCASRAPLPSPLAWWPTPCPRRPGATSPRSPRSSASWSCGRTPRATPATARPSPPPPTPARSTRRCRCCWSPAATTRSARRRSARRSPTPTGRRPSQIIDGIGHWTALEAASRRHRVTCVKFL